MGSKQVTVVRENAVPARLRFFIGDRSPPDELGAGAVNTAMVHAYWSIGREIVETEQHGEERAGYGEAVIEEELRAELAREREEAERVLHLAADVKEPGDGEA